jgi:23S rRNA pseudouridine1911/1915/1917 synthase
MNQFIKVLAETTDYLIIDKPAGLVVHGDGKSKQYTLCDWILEKYPGITGVGEPMVIEYGGEQVIINRPGIVHRLDRETSGVMVIAKTQNMFEHLKHQFQEHEIKKIYTAIVMGHPRDGRGMIAAPIGRSNKDIRMWTCKGARGTMREAITRYVVKNNFENSIGKFSHVDLYPQTGRTHQLRVHMKYIGNPIIGDGLYAPTTVGLLDAERTMLHARELVFKDLEDKEIRVNTEVPSDFKIVLQNLSK